jgi:hypothetical protein
MMQVKKICFYALTFLIIMLCFFDRSNIASALIIVLLCIQPSIYLASRTRYISLRLFCYITLITQLVTVPVFFLRSNDYEFSEYRPFGFSLTDIFPPFILLGIFLFLVAISVKLAQIIFGSPLHLPFLSQQVSDKDCLKNIVSKDEYPKIKIIGIFLAIVISLPLKFWMFDLGIGIVGVQPPLMPYKLSGILTYLFNMAVPILIGYLYIKTKRNSLVLALIIHAYSILIGVSAASKSAALFSIAPIFIFAFLDKRWIIFIFSILISGISILIASESREIIHIINGNSIEAYVDLGVIQTLFKTFQQLDWSWNLFFIYSSVVGRIFSFQDLWLSYNFNSEVVGGPISLFLSSIKTGLVRLDHDALHLEYLGHTIPYGFYGVGASLNSWMMMACNSALLMLLPFAIYAAATIIVLECSLMRVALKYEFSPNITNTLLFFFTLWFFAGPGSNEFLFIFISVIIFSYLPKLRLI